MAPMKSLLPAQTVSCIFAETYASRAVLTWLLPAHAQLSFVGSAEVGTVEGTIARLQLQSVTPLYTLQLQPLPRYCLLYFTCP
jgi:hypothetical protein